MGGEEKQGSNEVFSDSLGWPLDLIAIEVLWFHKRPPLACRRLAGAIKTEKKDFVLAVFQWCRLRALIWWLKHDSKSVSLIWFLYTSWYGLGKMQQMWETWKFFCWEEDSPRLCWRRNGGRWEMRGVLSGSLYLQCSAAEMVGNTQGNSRSCLMWSLSLIVHPRAEVSSLDKRKGFVCPGAAGLFSWNVIENFLGRYMTIMTQACVYNSVL